MFFVFWNLNFLKSWHVIINIFRFSPKNKRTRYPSISKEKGTITNPRSSDFHLSVSNLQIFVSVCSTYSCYTLRKAVFFINSTFSASGSTHKNDTIAMGRCGEGLGHTTPDCRQLNIWIFWQILVQEPVRPHSLQVPLQKLQWWLQRGCSLGELEVEEFCERKTILNSSTHM